MNVISSGVLIISGVSSAGFEVVQSGVLRILANGRADEVTAASGGAAVVSAGGILYMCMVSGGGTATVMKNAYAQDVTVASGGLFVVSSGGTAHQSLIRSGGTQIVLADVTVASATVQSGGLLTVGIGGYVWAPDVSENGRVDVWSQGIVDNPLVSGTMTVNNGARVNSAMIRANGSVEVLSNGYAYRAMVSSGGSLIVEDGGIVNSTVMFSGGILDVLNGGSCYNATVSRGGFCIVNSGGSATDTVVKSGGTMTVSSGGSAFSTVVQSGAVGVETGATASLTTIGAHGAIYVSSGGTAVDLVENGGCVYYKSGAVIAFAAHAFSGLSLTDDEATVHSGTTAVSTTVGSGGFLRVYSGGSATDTTAGGQGRITVYSDGRASRTTLNDQGGCEVMFRGAITDAEVNAGGSLVVYSRGSADGATVNSGGRFTVYEGGSAAGIVENGGYVSAAKGAVVAFDSHTVSALELAAASATVHAGTVAAGWTVNEGGRMDVFDGGIADATAVNPSGTLNVYSGGRLAGRTTFGSGAAVSMFEGAVVDFDLTRIAPGEAALVNDWSVIRGTPVCTLRVDTAVAIGSYTYVLAEGAAAFDGTITVANAEGGALGTLGVGETLRDGYTGCTLNLNGASLTLTVFAPDLTPMNLAGTADRVSWDPNWAETYTVEFSTDGFEHVLRAETSGTAVDLLALPAGTYQWRVTADAQSEWAVGNDLVSGHDPEVPEVLRSNDDGCGDVFFAEQDGVWDNRWGALHVGSLNDWSGTRELILTTGRGRIRNLFFGSDDPNVLCLTDLENGDALFVDDVYTELPEGVAEQQARLYRIREIRAGAGDDVVDMTSQRFEYTGSGLTVRGGDGDDVIWANKGSNRLFGDSGNDRIVGASGDDVIAGGSGDDSMHGGGGDDVFTFGENWGADTVEQLGTGSVTLWFASGGIENWDPATLTYTDGDNRVRVTGVTADRIALEFGGGDDPARYESLRAMGAFDAFTSEKIFEAGGTGFLASL